MLMLFNDSNEFEFRIIFGCIIVLILVSCLVYTEILVFSCFGMEKYTSAIISERGSLENKQEYSLFPKTEIDLSTL